MGTCVGILVWPLGTCADVTAWPLGTCVGILGWPLDTCADVTAWPLGTCVGILDGHWVLVLLCLDYFVQWIAIAAVGSVHRSTAEQRFALWPLATFERR